MNNDTRGVEQHAANIVVVFPVILIVGSSGEDGIKERVRIWQCAGQFSHWLDRPRIDRSRTAQPRIHDIVEAAIGLAVVEFIAQI